MATSLDTACDAAVHALIHNPRKAKLHIEAFLAVAAKVPYGGIDGRREERELWLLNFAMPLARRKTKAIASVLWLRFATEWTAHAPKAGEQHWYTLARAHRKLEIKLPAKLRDPIRRAWALGRMHNAIGERAFAIYERAKTSDAKLAALRAIATKAESKKRFQFWECICAALLLLDEPDAELASACFAKWLESEGADAEPSLYEA